MDYAVDLSADYADYTDSFLGMGTQDRRRSSPSILNLCNLRNLRMIRYRDAPREALSVATSST